MSGKAKTVHTMIRFALHGCTNRPYYSIVVMKSYKGRDRKPIDTIGTFDPMTNRFGEKLVAIDFDKLRTWIGRGAHCSVPVEKLLGYAGYFPIHPRTRLQAFRAERKTEQEQMKSKKTTADSDTNVDSKDS